MLAAMPTPLFLPAASMQARAQALRPGLWTACAALVPAADAAAVLCPAAVPLAARHYRAPARRQAFLAGRAVAATALAALHQPTAVGRAADGAPQWPAGVVGSIAHDGAQAVAVVGLSRHWQALGVDVEPDLPLPEDAASLVLRSEDEAALAQHFGPEAPRYGRLVFGAKECVHKALHPWRGAWLEFDAVRIEWQGRTTEGGEWLALPVSAEAKTAFADTRLQGRWWRQDGALFTLLTVSA